MDGPWITALSTYSSTRESILEHRFLAEVASCLWHRGEFDFAVSHSEVDNSGYDVIVEARGITRHIQLKATRHGGSTRDFPVQRRLEDKPSGCVVLLIHDTRSLAVTGYGWFGGAPGHGMPTLGDKPARHSKGNGVGYKAERPALRTLARSRFEAVADVDALVDRLFGAGDASEA